MPTEFEGLGKEIPWAWSEVVCSCVEPQYRHWQDIRDKKLPDICLRCNKLPKWMLVTCNTCDEQYIWRFNHQETRPGGWARHVLICWNCLCETDPPDADSIPPVYTNAPRVARSLDELALDTISFDFN